MTPMASHTLASAGSLAALCGVLLVALAAVPAHGAGQAVGLKHPVLKHDLDPARAAEYQRAVARVMAMSEEEMLAFVPDRPFCRFCYCPHCHAGYPGDTFTWTVERPNELQCKQCGTTYPNAAYPDDQVMTGPNALGESFSYPFQVDKQTGIRIFLPAHLLMHRRNWIVGQCRALGIAYQVTKKPEYACRAALILDRIAQVYPHYPVMDQWITTFYIRKSQQPPYPSAGGKWGRWAEDELPGGVPEAYDLVYDSPEFDRLSGQRGYDVRERFEKDFLKACFAYEDTFGPEINAGNIAPRERRLRGAHRLQRPAGLRGPGRWQALREPRPVDGVPLHRHGPARAGGAGPPQRLLDARTRHLARGAPLTAPAADLLDHLPRLRARLAGARRGGGPDAGATALLGRVRPFAPG